MIDLLKKIILTTPPLRFLYRIIFNLYISKKYNVVTGRNVFIGLSSVFEKNNAIGTDTIISNSGIGYGSYVSNNSYIHNTSIGRFCSIGPNVNCIFGNHPTKTFVSTHPSFFSTTPEVPFTFVDKTIFNEFSDRIAHHKNYSIEIGHDVWIGAHVLILDGVKIGDGAIVAAGSVVTKNVKPFSIVGGVPARLIRYRFSETEISFLKELKWWDKEISWIKKNAPLFKNISDLMLKYNENV